MQLIFATQNQHKIEEINSLVPNNFKFLSLRDLNYYEELPETHETLHENAIEKANFIHHLFKTNCFAEDTGLEVEALNGAPGVYSARYAGEQRSHTDNINLLLSNLNNVENRKARFRTIIALVFNDKQYLFEGIVNGLITEKPIGNKGFGYDPIFIAEGHNKTFAELDMQEKSFISHRSKAFNALKNFLFSL